MAMRAARTAKSLWPRAPAAAKDTIHGSYDHGCQVCAVLAADSAATQ